MGTTLIEALVAMIISSITLVMGSGIFVKVTETGNEQQKLNAVALLNKVSFETIKEKRFLDENTKDGSIRITKTLAPYKDFKAISRLSLKAYDEKNQILAERNELIATE